MPWLQDSFRVPKPVIGMCHLPPLPGDPGYGPDDRVEDLVAYARTEVAALQEGGIDAILISNEFSLPYLTRTEPITAITMARIIGELRSDLTVPFGVNVLWDGIASLDLAAATGATFVREIYTGVYASDFGLWDTNVGAAARHRQHIRAGGVRMLFNVVPEGATYLADRDLARLTRSTVFNAKPDGICVSGLTAGSETSIEQLRIVKDAAGETPVFVNTGVTPATVGDSLGIADGAIVGTFLKEDGRFEHRVDVRRVTELMTRVHALRG
jgi:uncharacterized protein